MYVLTTRPYARAQLARTKQTARGGGRARALHGLGDVALSPFYASTEAWRDLVSRYADGIPVEFLLAWINRESGGNPCSYTSLRESGIFQLEPPDNTNVAGTTEEELRPACSGQSVLRAFTDAEKDVQVRSGIRYVNWARAQAHKKLDAAGVDWPESSPDFWRVVKLQHAYPAPTSTWLATATAALGRPPATWAEMRAANPGARQDVLDNAEWVGGFGVGGGGILAGSSAAVKLALLGGLGILAVLVARQAR